MRSADYVEQAVPSKVAPSSNGDCKPAVVKKRVSDYVAEFLVRHGRDDYAERLSTAAPEGRHAVLLAIVDAVDAGQLVLNP